MKLEVFSIQGEKTGKEVELPQEIFGIEPNEHVVYLAVRQYLANQRQGTHKSKERADIAGSTRKLKKQKGTGTARAGSIKSPVFRGGGRVFGPRPRSYSFKLNKKVKRLARNSALASKLQKNEIIVVEDFTFDAPQTKAYKEILANLNLADKRSLLVTGANDQNIYGSSKNLKKANVIRVDDLNTYAVLDNNCLILSESSIDKMKELFA
ncbi:MAG: large subunit ribosomal protein L4 [Cognaticolwellia sp.]|mgnify:CR=1 FL=1|jgi:large subunit ribosomal protein L4|tara:strand:- start:33 stop:659 length:627 start_codon:yes stop_codon:yes gene_type:complete